MMLSMAKLAALLYLVAFLFNVLMYVMADTLLSKIFETLCDGSPW